MANLGEHSAIARQPIRLGTRASPLALAQAKLVIAALREAWNLPVSAFEIAAMTTSGDRIQNRRLADVGGKALWTRELDTALTEKNVDITVHSMKDVETWRPAHFALGAILPRADVHDRLVVRGDWKAQYVTELPRNARVGTSSPRRAAQLLAARGDLVIVLLRGNVATRLSRITDGTLDATLLAAAGLERLGMAKTGTPQSLEHFLPAASQGAVGVEFRARDERIAELLAGVNDPLTYRAVMMERQFLAAIGGDCQSAIAAYAHLEKDDVLTLEARLYAEDGSTVIVGKIADVRANRDSNAIAEMATDMLRRSPPSIRALFAP